MAELGQQKVVGSLLQLECEVWGEAPIQALGTVGGRDFYFRSRNTEWTFEVAAETGDLPSDVGAAPIFFRRGKCSNASYIPLDEAVCIIKRCAQEYMTEAINELRQGKTAKVRPQGGLMRGRIESGQLVTLEPVPDTSCFSQKFA